MSKVLILGAGASHGHGVKGEIKPPTTKGFFAKPACEKVAGDYTALLYYIESILRIDLQNSKEADIENIFAVVEPSWKMGLHTLGDIEAQMERFPRAFLWTSPPAMLSSFIVDVIHVSTSWLESMTCPYHDALVRDWLEKGDCVINFNYDLIMDQSLARSGRWSEASGYGWRSRVEARVGAEADSEIVMLKLHGSINWWKREIRSGSVQESEGSDGVDTIKVRRAEETIRGKAPGEAFARPPRIIPDLCEPAEHMFPTMEDIQNTLRLPVGHKRRGLLLSLANPDNAALHERMLPLLVMPTPYKSFEELAFGELRVAWWRAREALESCQEILAIGFSFRDRHFMQTLAEALAVTAAPPSFTLVLPVKQKDDVEHVQRLRSYLHRFHVKLDHKNERLEDYISRR